MGRCARAAAGLFVVVVWPPLLGLCRADELLIRDLVLQWAGLAGLPPGGDDGPADGRWGDDA